MNNQELIDRLRKYQIDRAFFVDEDDPIDLAIEALSVPMDEEVRRALDWLSISSNGEALHTTQLIERLARENFILSGNCQRCGDQLEEAHSRLYKKQQRIEELTAENKIIAARIRGME